MGGTKRLIERWTSHLLDPRGTRCAEYGIYVQQGLWDPYSGKRTSTATRAQEGSDRLRNVNVRGPFNHFVGANGTERNEDAAKGRSVEDRALARDSRLCLRSTTSTSTAFHPNRTCLQNILAILNLTREVFLGRLKIAGELLRPLREKNED